MTIGILLAIQGDPYSQVYCKCCGRSLRQIDLYVHKYMSLEEVQSKMAQEAS